MVGWIFDFVNNHRFHLLLMFKSGEPSNWVILKKIRIKEPLGLCLFQTPQRAADFMKRKAKEPTG
jgi:hypothetical protein